MEKYNNLNNPPLHPREGACVLSLGTCAYVTLNGKSTFADMVKVRILRWIDCPGLSAWAHCNHKHPHKKEGGWAQSD